MTGALDTLTFIVIMLLRFLADRQMYFKDCNKSRVYNAHIAQAADLNQSVRMHVVLLYYACFIKRGSRTLDRQPLIPRMRLLW